MRYAWDQFDAYFGRERIGAARNALARPVLAWLARWDRETAHRVHHFVANSRFVAGRIHRYYNRQASVLYPPANVEFFTPTAAPPGPYFLVVSALVPYKRIDVAIRAAQRLGAPLKIVGTGPDRARLEALADGGVEFLGAVDDEALREAYRGARALILPAEEDFGIAPVESLASGRPVVALGRGGATETVIDGETGFLVDAPDPDAFAERMDAIDSTAFPPARLAAHARRFSTAHFESGFMALLDEHVTAATAC
jgi:glycosyltransferase involved in cell wall biosynthesis